MCTQNPPFGRVWFTDHDETDRLAFIQCRELHELEQEVKVGYYLWKAFKWLKDLPPIWE